MIDLHTHSTFSDGSLTPEQLAQEAKRIGLSAVALTDHDGMNGVDAFLAACRSAGIRGVPGVEISVDFNPGTMHMLGYFLDHRNGDLAEALARLRASRQDRNRIILDKLRRLGFDLSWDEVAAWAGDEVVGRPHFAQALVARGFVRSTEDAFDRWLAKGKPAYVDRYRLSAEDSIALIRQAGGVPVLAHPSTLALAPAALREFVRQLSELGLQGLEAYYSEHTPEQEKYFLNVARECGLVVSGGSDFHGALNTGIRLGCGFGRLRVPDELVDLLYARRRSH